DLLDEQRGLWRQPAHECALRPLPSMVPRRRKAGLRQHARRPCADLRNERRRVGRRPAHQRPRPRLLRPLVARRHEDRFRQRSRRQLRDLRHERRRLARHAAHQRPGLRPASGVGTRWRKARVRQRPRRQYGYQRDARRWHGPAEPHHKPCERLRPRLEAAIAMNPRRIVSRSLIGASLFLLAACGSDSTAPGGGRPVVSVSVVPPTASLLTSGSQDFTATVANDPSNSGVTWSITGCSGGPAACGSLSRITTTQATYTAPPTVPPGGPGVTATSVADPTKAITATVAVAATSTGREIA